MNTPLVSIICLSYNHERFVAEAIESVFRQTYSPIQLIVVDDHSTDQSASVIEDILSGHPEVEFFPLASNEGNCKAFNRGFEKTKGEFIIDLAADDVLEPERVEKGLKALQEAGKDTGVHFSNAQLIDENGTSMGYHADRSQSIPQGDIYKEVLSRYFISTPTMMTRREVFEKLGGYDESLAYEDFDFWVRSSRYFRYIYSPEALVKRRVLTSSMGKNQYKRGSAQLASTLKVCEKALALNRTPDERHALRKRMRYEMRKALTLGELRIAWSYLKLQQA